MAATGIRVKGPGTQTIPSGAITVVTLDTLVSGASGFFSDSDDRLIVPVGGSAWYWIWGNLALTQDSSNEFQVIISINGTGDVARQSANDPTVSSLLSASGWYYLADDDYVQLTVFNSLADKTVLQTDNFTPEFGLVTASVITFPGGGNPGQGGPPGGGVPGIPRTPGTHPDPPHKGPPDGNPGQAENRLYRNRRKELWGTVR